jgi:acyl-CoA hydrolase
MNHSETFKHFVNPSHLNGYGTLHGGWLLQWMDESAAITATGLTGKTCVTRFISDASFEDTAKGGDIVEITVRLAASGRTSLTFSVEAKNLRTGTTMARIGKIVFVALDAAGHPVPTGLPSA